MVEVGDGEMSALVCMKLMAVLVMAASGQTAPLVYSNNSNTDKDGPMLYIAERFVDVGDVREGKVAEATYVIENRGTRDLVIESVQASCGCTTVKLTEEEKVIKPGSNRKLVARFDSTGRLGRQRKTIVVKSNDPLEPQVNLTLLANVETIFKVLPNPQLLLRSARRGMELPYLEVFPAIDGASLDKLEVEVSDGLLEYKREPTQDKDGTPGVRLTFTVPAEVELGVINGVITLKGEVGGEKASMPVRVTGHVVGDLVARPAVLQSLDITPRGRGFAPITIAATNDKPFEILSIDAGEFIDVEYGPRKQGKDWFVKTKLRDNAPDGPLALAIMIRTNNSGQPLLRIPVFVNVRSRVESDPELVLLGDKKGASTRRVRIQSSLVDKLEIFNISCDHPGIRVNIANERTYVGDVRSLLVILQETAPRDKPFKATVTFKTNVPGVEEFRIPVEFIPGEKE